MAQNVVVSLAQLCDLALCGPEPGAVNFNILHTLLHIIIQQLDKPDLQVEFQGEDNERMQNILAAKLEKGPSLNLTEYVIVGGEKKEKRRRKSKDEVLEAISQKRESKDKMSQTSQHSLQRIIVVESTDEKAKIPTVAVTRTHFDTVVKDVEKIKEQVRELTDLPGNLGLIEAIQGDRDKSPVLEMYQLLNLSKRIEAAEEGVEKMATLVEDVVKNNVRIVGVQGSTEMLDKAKDVRQSFEGASKTRLNTLERRLSKIEKFFPDDQEIEVIKSSGDKQKSPSPTESEESIADTSLEGKVLRKLKVPHAMAIIQNELEQLKSGVGGADPELLNDLKELKSKFEVTDEEGEADLPLPLRMNQLTLKYQETVDRVNTLDTMYNNQVKEIFDSIDEIQKRIEAGSGPGRRSNEGDSGIGDKDTGDRVYALETELNDIMEQANDLQKKYEMRQMHMDAMLEQIELLKIVKADREDLEDALGNKADACQINRKVSLDKFESTCNDINKNLEEALEKLSEQEKLWQEIIDNIQREMSCKLDKSEVDPLREFVNSKLKQLQEKLKMLAELKKEREAAGVKSKVLRDVNCISCDKDVVMKRQMEPAARGKAPALQPTSSMAPYLAYELDQLRKQQKMPHGRNMNYLEKAIKESKNAKDAQHIMCNRYCGGSHTVTTPQQRVTRTGHFMEQFGPDVAPLEEEYVRGIDNHLYKSRDEEKMKMAILASGKKKSESQGDPTKPMEEKRRSKDLNSPDKNKQAITVGVITTNAEAKVLLEVRTQADAQGQESSPIGDGDG